MIAAHRTVSVALPLAAALLLATGLSPAREGERRLEGEITADAFSVIKIAVPPAGAKATDEAFAAKDPTAMQYLGGFMLLGERGLPAVILRLTLPTAPDEWDEMAAAGTGSPRMTHLEDVAQAYRLALEKDGLGFEIFHIGPEDRDGRLPIDKAKRILGYAPRWSF